VVLIMSSDSTWFETLGGLDASFLHFEDRTAHMHVGSVAVFARNDGAPSYAEFVAHVASRLPRVPRYRQRLAFVPLSLGRPAWVDDDEFDIEYHVRHTALPKPGGDAALNKLAARVFSQRLDRDKPLWELYLVDDVGNGRFAIISKTHHCMVDGVSGVDLASVLLDVDKIPAELPSTAPAWSPRPAPDPRALMRSSLAAQVGAPFEIAQSLLARRRRSRRGDHDRNGASDAVGDGARLGAGHDSEAHVDDAAARALHTVKVLLGGVKPLISIGAQGLAPSSSLNQTIGPHRRWETLAIDLAAVKSVRAALGGTVNDVVLAVVAGAMRSFLSSRGESVARDLRIMVPVSVRAQEDRGKLGNQVAAIFCSLPVSEPDAVRRLHSVSKTMSGLKQNKQAVGALALTKLSDFAPPTLAAQAARLSLANTWFNLVVTNVPGPQLPIYLRGREMLACYPLVPLAPRQTVGIALLSYNGHIDIGLLGDADRARDLPLLGKALEAAIAELVAAARSSTKVSTSGARA
jgi:WS/DGAT/MGAT family acyltransferase